jgi:hypothetical protein
MSVLPCGLEGFYCGEEKQPRFDLLVKSKWVDLQGKSARISAFWMFPALSAWILGDFIEAGELIHFS